MQRRFAVFANLLLAGFLAGCTAEVDMANMRDNTLHSTQIRSEQVTTIQDRMAQLEESETERQRGLLRMTAALDELRLELRKLRGELEEFQYRQEQAGNDLNYRLTALDQRLRILETRPATGGAVAALDPGSEPPPLPGPQSGIEPAAPSSPPEAEPPVAEPPAAPPETETAVAQPVVAPPEAEPVAPPPASPPQTETAVAPPPADDPEAVRLFQRARQDYQQGNYEVAIILFKQYLRQFPQSAQAGGAQYWVGESLYAQKEYNAAIVAFDEVIQQYPRNDRVAAATLKVGLSFANLDDKPNAEFFYRRVQENFPNSAEAQLATEKLKQLRR